MTLSERRLRNAIRTLLEAEAIAQQGPTPAPAAAAPAPAAPTQQAATAPAPAEPAAPPPPRSFNDDLADLIAKKMAEMGISEDSINDMRRAVAG